MMIGSYGIVRKIDNLGRVCIPIEVRKDLDLTDRDLIEIFVKGETIILKKYKSLCAFCGNDGELEYFGEKNICRECNERLKMTGT